MTIYCQRCDRTHRFTAGDVERMLYTLQGALHDAKQEPDALKYLDERGDCLKDVLRSSHHIEEYLEHTTACVDARRQMSAQHATA